MGRDKKKDSLNSEHFVTQLRSRDPAAIEAVVRNYTEHLYRGALGLGFDRNSAHELVARVWTTFYEVVPKFEGRSHVRTFLFGILYNKASELRRENSRFSSTDPVEEILEKRFDSEGKWSRPPIDPEQFLIASETIGFIQECLEHLPLVQRMAFYLKEIEEHGSAEICKVLNISVTNLGVLLFRARNRLRECLEGKVGMSAK